MKVDVLLGLQWGDEGKGKVVDVLTPKYDVVARFQGGPNAGSSWSGPPCWAHSPAARLLHGRGPGWHRRYRAGR